MHASRGVRSADGPMCWLLPGVLAWPGWTLVSDPFPCPKAGRKTTSRPQDRDDPGSDYLRFVPFRVPSFPAPALHLSAKSTTYPEFPPSSRHRLGRPLHVRAATPHYVPPSDFLSLSAVCSGPGSTGLFHPATTSRVLPVQGLPASCSRPASSAARAPLPLDTRPSPSKGRWPRLVPSASRL
jgi:hypothetical protein